MSPLTWIKFENVNFPPKNSFLCLLKSLENINFPINFLSNFIVKQRHSWIFPGKSLDCVNNALNIKRIWVSLVSEIFHFFVMLRRDFRKKVLSLLVAREAFLPWKLVVWYMEILNLWFLYDAFGEFNGDCWWCSF